MNALVDSEVLADPSRTDGHDAEGTAGDCLRACLATVLGVPLQAVSHAAQHLSWPQEVRRQALLHDWDIGWFEPTFPAYLDPPLHPWVVACGPSPRGSYLHCVVVDQATGELVHDPHPSRAGLAGPPIDVMLLLPPGMLPDLPTPLMLEAS